MVGALQHYALHWLVTNICNSRQARMKSQLEKHKKYHHNVGDYIPLEAMDQGNATSTNLEHTVCDIHDILKSYYKVARKRFVDNVMMQAADYHLVTGPDSPIKVFTPAFVSDLTAEQLEQIAGEHTATKRRRAELKREIESLEKGKKMI